MAAQLTPKRFSGMFATGNTADMHIPARILTGACLAVVTLCIVSLIIAARTAARDEETALRRHTDIQALLAVPPADLDALRSERDAAASAATAAEAQLAPPSVDPSSDAATAMLVRRATEAGLAVQGISRVPPSQVKDELVTYEVEGLRVTVEGQTSKLLQFMRSLGTDEPGLIPHLESMTVTAAGIARAEVTFNVFTREEEPAAVPAAPGRTAQ